jgi:protein-tyrosine phosphatase
MRRGLGFNVVRTPFATRTKLTIRLAELLFLLVGISAGGGLWAGAPSDPLTAGQSLGIYMGMKSLPNLRDLGGYVSQDGRVVARGKIYRSNSFFDTDENDLLKLHILNLKSDVDLRTPAEIIAQPDRIPTSVNYIRLNVMEDENLIVTPAQIETLFKNPILASKNLGGTAGVEARFVALYRDLVSLPSAQNAYRILFLSFLDATAVPAVFHCTNGKDRTGWAAAAWLTLLGVSKEDVMTDYLRSNDYLLPMHEKEASAFILGGGDPGIPEALYGVKKKYLDSSLAELYQRYGTIERYFSEGLKINAKQQQQLQDIYLVGMSLQSQR